MMDNLSEISEEQLRDSHGVSYGQSCGGSMLVDAGDGNNAGEDSPSASSHGLVQVEQVGTVVEAAAGESVVHTHGAAREVFSPGGVLTTTGRPSSLSRVVVVTSHGALGSTSHTLTLHRIQVKEELQTAAEDLSISSGIAGEDEGPICLHASTEHHYLHSHPHANHHQHHHHHHTNSHHHHHPHHHHLKHDPEDGQENNGAGPGRDSEQDLVDGEELCGESKSLLVDHSGGGGGTTLTVIVPRIEDEEESNETELLSPKVSPTGGISVSVGSMIDASEFHRGLQTEHGGYQALNTSVLNGRLSPAGYSPSGSGSTPGGGGGNGSQQQYATLTPLQPLPPISTMSDKFSYGHAAGNVAGSFTVMHNNGLGGLGVLGVSSPYSSYEKLSSMSMSPPHHYSSPTNGLVLGLSQQPSPSDSPQHYSQNGLASPPKALSPNGYESYSSVGSASSNNGASNNNANNSGNTTSTSTASRGGSRDLRATLHHVVAHQNSSQHSHSPSLSPPLSLHHSSPPPQQQQQQQQQQQHHVSMGGPFSVSGVTLASSVNGLTILSSHNNSSPDHSPTQLATAVVVAHRDASSPATSSPMSMSNSPLIGINTSLPSGQSMTTQAVITAVPTSQHHSHAHSHHPHINHTGQLNNSGVVTTHILCSDSSLAIKTSSSSVSASGIVSSSAVGGSNVNLTTSTPAGSGNSGGSSMSGSGGELEEINTKELAARISAELKRYSIPQAIFAQRVLCRSQGTLSDLLRNPKPWSKLKSGRETFRRMWKWLQEPEFQRMSALRLAGLERPIGRSHHRYQDDLQSNEPDEDSMDELVGCVGGKPSMHSSSCMQVNLGFNCGSEDTNLSSIACKRKDEQQSPADHPPPPKKPRLVFTDLQRRTLQAIFKETKRPSKEMQVTIARQLGLEPTTVGNFFMNARRRSMDKWKEENSDGGKSVASTTSGGGSNGNSSS